MGAFFETFTDFAADSMEIRSSAGAPGTAVIDFEDNDQGTVHIPAHRLAEVVTALYKAAGQPVPDLPVIDAQAGAGVQP